MKKCATIIFYSALFLLFSCADKKRENSVLQPIVEEAAICDTIKIHENYTFAYDTEKAPELTIDIELPSFNLASKSATAKLDSALAWSIFFEGTTLCGACNNFIAAQKEYFNELRDEFHNLNDGELPPGMMHNYVSIKATTLSGYKDYISYITTREEYYGGAHPSTVHTILCFNPTTGSEIALKDIFKEGYEENLIIMLIAKLMQDIGVSTIDELCDCGYYLADMFISQNFILEKDSIIFLYNRYEIAPYALGDIKISLDYNTLKEIMK